MALSVDDIKRMPLRQKVLALFVLFILFGFAYFSLYYQNAIMEEEKLEQSLAALQIELAQKQKLMEEKIKFEQEIARLQEQLKVAMAKLPEQKEIPGLLISMSEAEGLGGVEFQLFEPLAPVEKEFYAELPVKISLTGVYHDTATFFEKVAKLPRIVNVSDISMEKRDGAKDGNGAKGPVLATSFLIKTYMFVEKPVEGSKKADGTDKKAAEKK
jgi:type IV pilus assembly protein PilO